MGNDGGSIPTRRELVKEAARNPTTTELKETQKELLVHRWSTCLLSHTPLARPIVSDAGGDLFNKDAVLQYLLPAEISSLNKEECDKLLGNRVKSLKDVVEVLFETDHNSKEKTERWVCPVTSKELGPGVKAVYLVPCGHAYSQEAIKEMKDDQCIQCNQAYLPRDVITILPTTEAEKSQVVLRKAQLSKLGLTHSLKKASGFGKKRKVNGVIKEDAIVSSTSEGDGKVEASTTIGSVGHTSIPRPSTSRSGSSTPKLSTGIKNAATATLTAKILEEEETKKKRRVQGGQNENLRSLFAKSVDNKKYRDGDFMTRGFSIPANARQQ